MPWLAVAHFFVDPEHRRPISTHDHFFSLEACVGVAGKPSPPEFHYGGFSLDASTIGRRRGILEHRVFGQKRRQRISVVPIEGVVEFVNGGAVACSCDGTLCSDLIGSSLGADRQLSTNTKQIITQTWILAERMGIRPSRAVWAPDPSKLFAQAHWRTASGQMYASAIVATRY